MADLADSDEANRREAKLVGTLHDQRCETHYCVATGMICASTSRRYPWTMRRANTEPKDVAAGDCRNRSLVGLVLLLGALILATGCASRALYQDNTPQVPASELRGDASWYGPGFAGRSTASGEVFDPGDFTAAHRTLPFGTMIRVVREDTRQWVVVRVNDRGPFVRGRVVDLSESAAREIEMIDHGHVPVWIEILSESGSDVSVDETPTRGRT